MSGYTINEQEKYDLIQKVLLSENFQVVASVTTIGQFGGSSTVNVQTDYGTRVQAATDLVNELFSQMENIGWVSANP